MLLDSTVATSHAVTQEFVQQGLRIAFLLIALGALRRIRSPLTVRWRWAAGSALTMLGCAVAGEFMAGVVHAGWIVELSTQLGAFDSLERRLFRLGAMAAFAIPMLALIAASEQQHNLARLDRRPAPRIAELLVRWEPILFAIGASALASALMAGAFVNKEFVWLTPIGADAAVAACVAATIRARWRGDYLAFVSWALVCFSMLIGLLMGIYAFGGPIPTPGFIGGYNTVLRTLLRDTHVVLMVLGVVGIAVAMARAARGGAR